VRSPPVDVIASEPLRAFLLTKSVLSDHRTRGVRFKPSKLGKSVLMSIWSTKGGDIVTICVAADGSEQI
jgi:hypothetical protein